MSQTSSPTKIIHFSHHDKTIFLQRQTHELWGKTHTQLTLKTITCSQSPANPTLMAFGSTHCSWILATTIAQTWLWGEYLGWPRILVSHGKGSTMTGLLLKKGKADTRYHFSVNWSSLRLFHCLTWVAPTIPKRRHFLRYAQN